MSLYVLDTDHVTLHQRNHPQVVSRIKTLSSKELATTVVTLEEQMRGRLAQLGYPSGNLIFAYNQLHATLEYFCDLNILPFDAMAQRQYQMLRSQKIHIGTLDLRIAAIVLSQNIILITRNQRDFEQGPGLKLEDWSQS